MHTATPSHPFHGRVALVTGASSGIGRRVALDLSLQGVHVIAWARRIERLHTLAEEAFQAGGIVTPMQVDMRNPDEILRGFESIHTITGQHPSILINNAGLGHKVSLVRGSEDDIDRWREMLDINVLALCICTRHAVTRMLDADIHDGQVIHISSMAAHRVPPSSGVYSATKYAVRSLTEGLRMELRALQTDIRITSISPGFVETEFAQVYHQSEEIAKEVYSQYKVLEDQDVSNAVLYVLGQPPHVQVHDILMRPTRQER